MLSLAATVVLGGTGRCGDPPEQETYQTPHGAVTLKWPAEVQKRIGLNCSFGSFVVTSPKRTQRWDVCAVSPEHYESVSVGDSFHQR